MVSAASLLCSGLHTHLWQIWSSIRCSNESLHSIRSDLTWATLVALGFIRLTSFTITPRKIILRADRGKVQVSHWSAGCIRWAKIVCKSCIMATMWHFYGDTTHLFMVWVMLQQLVVHKGSVCTEKMDYKALKLWCPPEVWSLFRRHTLFSRPSREHWLMLSPSEWGRWRRDTLTVCQCGKFRDVNQRLENNKNFCRIISSLVSAEFLEGWSQSKLNRTYSDFWGYFRALNMTLSDMTWKGWGVLI